MKVTVTLAALCVIVAGVMSRPPGDHNGKGQQLGGGGGSGIGQESENPQRGTNGDGDAKNRDESFVKAWKAKFLGNDNQEQGNGENAGNGERNQQNMPGEAGDSSIQKRAVKDDIGQSNAPSGQRCDGEGSCAGDKVPLEKTMQLKDGSQAGRQSGNGNTDGNGQKSRKNGQGQGGQGSGRKGGNRGKRQAEDVEETIDDQTNAPSGQRCDGEGNCADDQEPLERNMQPKDGSQAGRQSGNGNTDGNGQKSRKNGQGGQWSGSGRKGGNRGKRQAENIEQTGDDQSVPAADEPTDIDPMMPDSVDPIENEPQMTEDVQQTEEEEPSDSNLLTETEDTDPETIGRRGHHGPGDCNRTDDDARQDTPLNEDQQGSGKPNVDGMNGQQLGTGERQRPNNKDQGGRKDGRRSGKRGKRHAEDVKETIDDQTNAPCGQRCDGESNCAGDKEPLEKNMQLKDGSQAGRQSGNGNTDGNGQNSRKNGEGGQRSGFGRRGGNRGKRQVEDVEETVDDQTNAPSGQRCNGEGNCDGDQVPLEKHLQLKDGTQAGRQSGMGNVNGQNSRQNQQGSGGQNVDGMSGQQGQRSRGKGGRRV